MTTGLSQETTPNFWAELGPCEHLVQFYENKQVFLDLLEGFVSGGLRAGEGVIVIATPEHREALNTRLAERGFDLKAALAADQYIALDAEDTMSKFMVRGWPDEYLFTQLVTWILSRAKGQGRKVRAFGEMVAVMWARGQQGPVVRLEELWHKLCHERRFPLLCAYPRNGFNDQAMTALKQICSTHSKVIGPEFTRTVAA